MFKAVLTANIANERTFLAWLRTALALSTVGLAISQLFSSQHADKTFTTVLGMAFIVLSMTFLVVAGIRYFKVQTLLVRRKTFPSSRFGILLSVVGALILTVAAFTLVVITPR